MRAFTMEHLSMPFDLTETTAKNPFADPAAMNMGDVKAKVAAAPDLPERAKSEMISALNSTALWLHRTLEELPANWDFLNRAYAKLNFGMLVDQI
jgi:hypothetical protein